jgi:CheY-like chemotaxis protein
MQMNKTILVFEDDPQVRQLLCSFLRRLGYEARTASDGATALGLARTTEPDLVVLDVDLPDGSGFDLCRAIKSRPVWVAENPSQSNRSRPSKLGGIAAKKIPTCAVRSVERQQPVSFWMGPGHGSSRTADYLTKR